MYWPELTRRWGPATEEEEEEDAQGYAWKAAVAMQTMTIGDLKAAAKELGYID